MRRLAIFTVVLVAGTALAEEPLKEPAVLAERLGSTTRAIADKHFALAKKLEKKHAREAYEELLLAIAVCPDHRPSREKLGFKKEGEVWRGAPVPPASPGDPLTADLEKQRDKERKDAASKLAVLARRAKLGGLDEWKRVAGLVLEEDPDDKAMRGLLGHTRIGEAWSSPREIALRAAFTKALEKAKEGEAKKGPEDEDLAKKLGLGDLDRVETEHAVFLASKATQDAKLGALSRAIEATFAAFRYYLGGEDTGFSVDGEPKREATGVRPAPAWKPRWLLLASQAEHDKWIELTAEKKEQDFGKRMRGWTSRFEVPPKTLYVHEGWFAPSVRTEWCCAGMAQFLTATQLAQKAKIPDFVLDGIRRWFAGHVSGRADIFYAATGASGGKRSFEAGSFDALRSRVRELFRESTEGELRALLSRHVNELERSDSARALAFIDWCLARERGGFTRFILELKPDEPPIATFEKAFGKSVEDVERELKAWVREEY